jgi:hypothetical protein
VAHALDPRSPPTHARPLQLPPCSFKRPTGPKRSADQIILESGGPLLPAHGSISILGTGLGLSAALEGTYTVASVRLNIDDCENLRVRHPKEDGQSIMADLLRKMQAVSVAQLSLARGKRWSLLLVQLLGFHIARLVFQGVPLPFRDPSLSRAEGLILGPHDERPPGSIELIKPDGRKVVLTPPAGATLCVREEPRRKSIIAVWPDGREEVTCSIVG